MEHFHASPQEQDVLVCLPTTTRWTRIIIQIRSRREAPGLLFDCRGTILGSGCRASNPLQRYGGVTDF